MIVIGHGVSMIPTLPRLSIIRTKRLEAYKVGDIISLKTLDNKLHIHRIVQIDRRSVSTKGDNMKQQWYEIKVPIQNITGKATWWFPKA